MRNQEGEGQKAERDAEKKSFGLQKNEGRKGIDQKKKRRFKTGRVERAEAGGFISS